MADGKPLSTSEAAAALGVPQWKLRRVVDAIAPQAERIGRARVVPEALMRKLSDELYQQGYIAAKKPQ